MPSSGRPRVRLEISYSTTYSYEPAIRSGLTALRIRPRSRPGLRVLSSSVRVNPGDVTASYVDGWGSQVDLVESNQVHASTTFAMNAVVETIAHEADMPPAPDEQVLFSAESTRTRFATIEPLGWTVGQEGASWQSVEAILGWIPQRFVYQVGATDAHTPLGTFLERGAGVCQDFAHLYLAILRRWGWCARYVSGYFFSADPDVERIEADAMHAWVEVYRPGTGWIGLDATAGAFADHRYVAVGYGRDYDDVSPVRGMLVGGTEQSQRARLQIVQQQQ